MADHNETVRLRPEISDLHLNCATALETFGARRGHFRLSRAAALRPKAAVLQYALGYRSARYRRLDEAKVALLHAISLEPNIIEALADFATLLLLARRVEQSPAVCDRTDAIAPHYPYLKIEKSFTAQMQLCNWQGLELALELFHPAILDRSAIRSKRFSVLRQRNDLRSRKTKLLAVARVYTTARWLQT